MELYQLRSFVAIAELGHLTRAAERLHVSQPAVSAQIKALEDELGVTLFERVSSGMVLTAAGRKLLPAAEKVLEAAQSLRMRAKAIQGEIVGRARVGTVSDPEFTRIGEFLARALEAHPLLDVEIHHEVSGIAFEKVRDGELDASFYYGSLQHPDVTGVPLLDYAYRIVGPAAWGDRLRHASWEELVQMPWILAPKVSTLRTLVEDLFAQRGSSPALRVEADNEAVMRSLVAAGGGVTVIREDLALESAASGDVALWNKVRLETTLKFLYLSQRQDDPVIRALLDVLHDIWLSVPAKVGEPA
ncbi:MAG: LysR family transcriptional regulator [Burkholderiales bacterium]